MDRCRRCWLARLDSTPGGETVEVTTFNGKTYGIDSPGFLVGFEQWDEDFAKGMVSSIGITTGLSERHWEVIRFIRNFFRERGYCPLVYQTCRGCYLRLSDLKRLFPSGYYRGACRLAGISYRHGSFSFQLKEGPAMETAGPPLEPETPTSAAGVPTSSEKT